MMVDATTQIPVSLEAQQWNIVLGALSKIPWWEANPVILAVRAQCDAFTASAPVLMPRPNGEDRQVVTE